MRLSTRMRRLAQDLSVGMGCDDKFQESRQHTHRGSERLRQVSREMDTTGSDEFNI